MKPDESKEQKLPNDHKLHFGDYFSAPGVRSLSVIIGLLIGCLTSIFTGWQIGVLSGAVMVLIVSVVLPIILYRADVPYQKIKQTMPGPFLFDERVRFSVRGGRTVGGFFILTEKTMVFLSLEQGNHRLELAREDVKSVVLEEDQFSMKIFLNNTQFIQVVSAVCGELYGILRDNRWITN